MNTTFRACAVTLALSFGWLLTPATIWAQTASAPAATQASTQRTFPTADAAADTLTQALRGNDDKTIAAILGGSWRDFVPGSQAEEDRQRASFLQSWDEEHKIVTTGDKAVTATLNQKTTPEGGFHAIGTYEFLEGRRTIVLGGKNANGNIHADAIQLVPAK